MAATNIVITKLVRNEADVIPATAAVNATDGAMLDLNGIVDEKLLILIENAGSAAKVATIKAGNGIQGVHDLEISVDAGKTVGIVIESMKFKNVSGENMGKVIILGASTDIKIAAVQL